MAIASVVSVSSTRSHAHMLTTALLYDVIVYGVIAAVTFPAIAPLFFLIRDGRHSGHDGFDMVPLVGIGETDSDLRSQHAADNEATVPHGEQQASETSTGRIRERSGEMESARPAANRRSVSREDPHVGGYVASNGILITPTVSGHSGGRMGEPPAIDPSATSRSHPHAEYWCYGDLHFYERR